jgi:ABC-type Na+ efflux pump permease subunit
MANDRNYVVHYIIPIMLASQLCCDRVAGERGKRSLLI